MGPLDSMESQIGTRAAVVNFFISDSESFPLSRCQSVAGQGSIPLVTLEFWSAQNGGLDAITAGSKDAYLRAFADSAKSYGKEVWLRPFHEMNGNWYPWSGTTNGNSAADLVAAWRHVRTIFNERGATNVKFVWCVNNDSVPNTSANSIEGYWPGDAYVDMVALDGYNWGTTQSWGSTWRSFGSTFSDCYKRTAALTAKPMFIAETACPEQGGSKAAWITDMFKQINTNYTRIKGVVWFNANKECDWRVESSSTSLAAFKSAAAVGY
jgi:endoglucanase